MLSRQIIHFRRAGGAVAWPLAVRAQQLLVGFSDDRRFFVPILVPFVFFVFSSSSSSLSSSAGSRGGIVSLPMMVTRLQMCSGHFGSCVDVVKLHDDVSAHARGRQSSCIAALHYGRQSRYRGPRCLAWRHVRSMPYGWRGPNATEIVGRTECAALA
jgi:hypothetical protein